MMVLAGIALLLPWQQTSTGTGRVVAWSPTERQQNIEAPIDGRIVRWWVQEGAVVKEGEPLLEIVDVDPNLMDRLTQERNALIARLQAAQLRAQSDGARMDALTQVRSSAMGAAESRVRMATDRTLAAEHSVEAAEKTVYTAELNMKRQQELRSGGLVSQRTLELAELEVVKARTDLGRARATLQAAKKEQEALQDDARRAGGDGTAAIRSAQASRASALGEIATVNGELARLDVRMARQASQSVKAPKHGVIMRVIANQGGEMVKQGETLAVLVPDTKERAVELWVDGNDAPLIDVGRTVRLQFEGWPAVQFSGWPSVAVGTFGGRVAVVDAADDGKGRFRVLVVPEDGDGAWPEARWLRQGTRANGWVMLNNVRIGFELWRQVNGFPVALPQQPAAGGVK